MLDFILNGQGYGDVASTLLACNGDPNALRPFIGADGRTYICTVNQSTGKPEVRLANNVTATLRKDAWIKLDEAIIKAAKPRLKIVSDLRGAGLQYSIPNGMSKTSFEWERQSDIGPATVSMDGLRRGNNDRPTYELLNIPLPIIHKDFSFTTRQLLVSQNSNSPLDSVGAELAARRVAEEIEQMTLGLSTAFQYAGGTLYGLTDFPQRNTKVITAPTAGGWAPATLIGEVLSMISISKADNNYGPWMVYCAPDWDEYMDDDYSAAKGDLTLRERIAKIEDIKGCKTLDYLTGFTLLLVQMTADNVRMVIGMEIVTVRWQTQGDMEHNFKVMAIIVPQVRSDITGKCGIVHGAPV